MHKSCCTFTAENVCISNEIEPFLCQLVDGRIFKLLSSTSAVCAICPTAKFYRHLSSINSEFWLRPECVSCFDQYAWSFQVLLKKVFLGWHVHVGWVVAIHWLNDHTLHPPRFMYIPQASYSFLTTCFPTLNVINYLIAVPLVLAILNVNLGASFKDAMCQSS